MTSERILLLDLIQKYGSDPKALDFGVQTCAARPATHEHHIPTRVLGVFRNATQSKLASADYEVIEHCIKNKIEIPRFLEAGPRKLVAFGRDDHINAAIVTTGGVAPGLNAVAHAITMRHMRTYSTLADNTVVFGYLNGVDGLLSGDKIQLDPRITEGWLDRGGSELGMARGSTLAATQKKEVRRIVSMLVSQKINILYVLGGNGSMQLAHAIATHPHAASIIVVGVPKTMDNDLLWVWQSFGFNSAVQEAVQIINALHTEAESTRATCYVEFFGRDSGFVAANAAFASGHVDLVLIPEVFEALGNGMKTGEVMADYTHYLLREVGRKRRTHNPHLVVVAAEGVGEVLQRFGITMPKVNDTGILEDTPVTKLNFKDLFLESIKGSAYIEKRFPAEPRYLIRSKPANPHDQIYCQRLGALAVDNGLAGYTDFMISQWLTEYVMVPLKLVVPTGSNSRPHIKQVPPTGMFWRQVEASTGQPHVDYGSETPAPESESEI